MTASAPDRPAGGAGWAARSFAPVGLSLALVLLVALFSMLSEHFLSLVTLRTIANQIPPLMVIAIGMTYVLIIGGIDLSVGSVLALSATAAGMAMHGGASPLVAAVLALLVGSVCGALNGSLSVGLGVPSFIVTLGLLEAARGAAYLVSGSQTQYLGSSAEVFAWPIGGLGLSASFLVAMVLVVVAQVVLTRTVFGRHLIAIGTNEEAVRLAGIDPRTPKIVVFVASACLAALAGLFQLGYLQSADPNAGIGMELSAIAAVVIGGTSLMGGRGSVLNSCLGVLIIAVLQTGLAQIGLSEPMKRVVTGAVIVVAAVLDVVRERVASRPKG